MSITPESPSDLLSTAVIGFTGCIGEALEDICSYGWTIGETYVPFDPDPDDDCDAEEVACSQAWVRVTGVVPTSVEEGFGGDCAAILSISLEVGILRCIQIPEDGEAPTASEVLVAAMQAIEDMNTIYCAAMGCDVWESITVGTWTPTGPLGGQYGGIWTFDVEL